MSKLGIIPILIAGVLAATQLQAKPSDKRVGIYALPGDTFFSYGQPTCGQKFDLKTAKRYAGWCREYSESYHPPCGLGNACSVLLSPVVAYCDDQHQGNIEHPGKGYEEPPICAEARRVYLPDQSEFDRREKAYWEIKAKLPPRRMPYAVWQKLRKKLDAEFGKN